MLVAVAVGWSAAREPAEVGPAQAAAVGAAPVVPRAVGCKVRYQVRQDDGDDFEVLLTVLNTGERGFVRWRLEFASEPRAVLEAEAKTMQAMREGRWDRSFIDALEARCNN